MLEYLYFSGAIQQREKLSTSAQKAAKEAEARVSAEISKMKQQLADKDKELNVSGGLALLFSLHPYSRLFMNVAWPEKKKLKKMLLFLCWNETFFVVGITNHTVPSSSW